VPVAAEPPPAPRPSLLWVGLSALALIVVAGGGAALFLAARNRGRGG
jgi:hypothetical protein